MKKIKKLIDIVVRFVLSLNETKRNETKRNETKRNETNNNMLKNRKWKEVQLFSNCTSSYGKESEGLDLCSLFDLKNRGAFLC